ncbi:TraR/DksA family transcriptional regulator [Escherichia coli]|uniref:TraR/DksA family transcriptional regulator n=1 Tax=Escherichia coli TaxID=562 RepID=UPI000A2E00AF|nr:TraR/DksA family transcriptional regulator [Escherichia coli]OTB79822.1 conjugal transfer protein TraR [Escherichia coli]TJQ17615.1 TraR/DksA family transcriptional regulator [Escherichia coli]
MADIADQASELEELQRNSALQKYQTNFRSVSSTHCCERGEPIDERRRLAVKGCRTCTSCQEDLELISKQRGSK